MKKVALTGNMGTGKSYTSRCLQEQGIFVLDMDACAKEVREAYQEELYALFSVNDANALASIIFHDDTKRQQLEDFLYPKMIEKMQDFFVQHAKEDIVVVEVALLFEKKWEVYFDEVWCVVCDEEVALQRLQANRGISKEQAKARLAKQDTTINKQSRSDFVIFNNEGDNVSKQIEEKLAKERSVC